MDMLNESGIHLNITEQAKNIARLADQVPDRRIKLHLIGVALGLLGLLENDNWKLDVPRRP
ncbi:MAG TPA: hypothetical protein VFC56_13980 [Stellaceae bacterium]|nr:hypothetical protein [Stellaceae bacterium]